MDWNTVASFAITQGPFGMVAVFLGWYLVKNQKEARLELIDQQKRHDEQMKELYAAIERNTKALTDLHSVTNGLNQIVTAFLQESLMTKSR